MAMKRVNGGLKIGKKIFYPVDEIIEFIEKNVVIADDVGRAYLDKIYANLRLDNPTGLISRKEAERQTGGMVVNRTLANLDSRARLADQNQ